MEISIDLGTSTSRVSLWNVSRLAKLRDPLLPVGVYEHHGSGLTCMLRKDLAKPWKIGAYEHSSVWISSRTFRNAVLYRGVEPLRREHAARASRTVR
jgi:hypothetical protein